MRRTLVAASVAAVLMGGAAAAHHSYSAYHVDRIIEIDGVLEEFAWANPHSLLKVRAGETLYSFEWRAANAMYRTGVERDTLKPGDRLIVTGNPHRDIAENGVANLKSIRRPSDEWRWPAR
jgi:hypothetical protein